MVYSLCDLEGRYQASDNAAISVHNSIVTRNGQRSSIPLQIQESDLQWADWTLMEKSTHDNMVWTNGEKEITWRRLGKKIRAIRGKTGPPPPKVPINATPDDIEGEWQGSDGSKVVVKDNLVVRDGHSACLEQVDGKLRWCGWRLVEKEAKYIVWESDGEEAWWHRINTKRRITGHAYIGEAKSDEHRNMVVDLIQSRLTKMKGIKNQVFNPDHVNLCLFDEGQLMASATMSVHKEQDFAECLFFAVDRSCSGYGTHLMTHIKAWAHSTGVHYVVVNGSNNALGFFGKQGFAEFDAERHLTKSMVLPRVFKVDNATLLAFDLTTAEAYVSAKQRKLVQGIKIGREVKVRYGQHKPLWVDGTITHIDGVKVRAQFHKGWQPEWIPITSVRLKIC